VGPWFCSRGDNGVRPYFVHLDTSTTVPGSGAAVMRYLPLFADLAGRRCVVVGGGETAARKLRLLLRADARPVVLAETVTKEIEEAAEQGLIEIKVRGFQQCDLENTALIVVSDIPRANAEAISAAAKRANVPINVVDNPSLSSVIFPGIVDRNPILVAIGGAGASPVLVRRLREQIERVLPPRTGDLARFAGRFRSAVASKVTDTSARRAFWERVIDGPVGSFVLAGKEALANEAMLRLVNSPKGHAAPRGSVALVGAGPGAADLLTLRALRLLQDADIVIHDALVGPEVLELIRRDADRIDVGKRKGNHRFDQNAINNLLLEHALSGRRVVRLKGGDPFLFGRGGEEQAFLLTHGINVEVVPGISAGLGAAASTGIPLTHRDHASAVTFMTGHRAGDDTDIRSDIALGDSDTTVVVYMGRDQARKIALRAIEKGRSPSTPVAVVDRATLSDERVLRGTLGTLGALVENAELAGPTLLIIGDVAALHSVGADCEQPRRAIG